MSEADNPTVHEPAYHEILTERLVLKTLRASDAEDLMPLLTSKAVMQWTTKPPVQNIAQAERWIKDRALGQDVFNFTISLRHPSPNTSVPIVGVAGTFHPPKVGYLIHLSHWGKGIASEALGALVPAIFERFPEDQLGYVEGWIDVENTASRRVLEKCGFVFCEEMDSPTDAPGQGEKVAVLRRAREGIDLKEMGLMAGKGGKEEEKAPTPPMQ